MRVRKCQGLLAVVGIGIWLGGNVVQAQSPAPLDPSAGVIPLELSPQPLAVPSPARTPLLPRSTPPAAPPPAIRPSLQGLDYRSRGGNAALQELRNPFEGGSGPEKRGLFGHRRPRYAPAPHGQGIPRRVDGPAPSPTASPFTTPGIPEPSPATAAPETPGGTPTAPKTEGAAPSPNEGPGVKPSTPETPGAAAPGSNQPGAASAESGAATPAAPAPAPAAATPGSGTGTAAAAANSAADLFGGPTANAGPGFGGTLGTTATPFAMIGDISPIQTHPLFSHVGATGLRTAAASQPPGPPPPPGARGGSPIYPSVRNFKIAENQSPRPQDRVFFGFNYYNNLNDTINRNDLSPITQMKAYVYNFGVEKTFNNGMGSIGIRLPVDNLTANSFSNIVSTPTSTATGNLTVFAKYILGQNEKTGSLISACFAITPQTGPGRFAGAPFLFPLNSTYFQPCLAYIYNYNRWYLQGFSGFSFPASPGDVSLIYNDIAVGYFLIREPESRRWLTALAPTVELHVNNPINHRDPLNSSDLAGAPDTVDMTFGLNFGIKNRAVLTAAFVTPLASLKPFDSEAVLLLNFFYGRSRTRTPPLTPPPL